MPGPAADFFVPECDGRLFHDLPGAASERPYGRQPQEGEALGTASRASRSQRSFGMGIDDRTDIAAAAMPTAQSRAKINEGDGCAIFLGIEREIGRGKERRGTVPVLPPVAAGPVVAPHRDRVAGRCSAAERRQF